MMEIIKNGEELARCYFADNDLIAIGAMKAIKEAGLAIPGDIAVAGFDNMPASTVIEPPLSTVHVPKQYLGEAAAKRLIELLESPAQPAVKIEIATTLMKRGSTGK